MYLKSKLQDLASRYDDMYWWRERIQNRVVGPVLAGLYGVDGVDVVERDWDNLLILDACRADMFEQTVDMDQFHDYETVRSRGSSSRDWIAANFEGRKLGDIVYVTSNPWVAREAPSSFHSIVDIWSAEQDDTLNTEDLEQQDLSTSPTSTVTATELNDAVREMSRRYPKKRYIVHYFQPHAPCIGKSDGTLKTEKELDLRLHPGKPLYEGRVSRDAVWEAYKENLAYVFHHARELARELGGKSVFSADHGELFGERLWPLPLRGYAHPEGLFHPSLVTVPWAETTHGDRRQIKAGETSQTEVSDKEITEQLEKLGYI